MGMHSLRLILLMVFIGLTRSAVFYKPTLDFTSIHLNPDHHDKSYKHLLESLKIKRHDLDEAINFAKNSLQRMERFEINLRSAGINAKDGTPTKGIYIVNSPNNISIARAKDALIVSKATRYLINSHYSEHEMTPSQWSHTFSTLSYKGSNLEPVCEKVNKKCTEQQLNLAYRLPDGSCNNENFGSEGESNTVYKRLLAPDYLDGVSQFRNSVTKKHLPSPRVVSTTIFQGQNETDGDLTMAVGQWWQFIEQDLSQTAASTTVFTGNEIECCDEGFKLSPRYQHSFCAPITIPENDPFYSEHFMTCMPYIRSLPGLRHDCSFGPRDQVNQATHFLDGSQIYGSNMEQQKLLRAFKDGQLKVSKHKGKDYLQFSKNPTRDCQIGLLHSKCFQSGDSRVNLNPYLTTLHTIWHREHNRIAGELAYLNMGWDDEKLFQEARRIVIAELQHITFNEYLPIVLGKDTVRKVVDGDYVGPVDPRVTNSFATAALRSLNSLMDDTLKLYGENRKEESFLDLEEYFNKPGIILKNGTLNGLIRSLSTQPSQRQDINYAADMINKLYSNGEYGLDVLSLDIQRGRDHGLRSYVHYRKMCGLQHVKHWEDFQDVMTEEAITSLKKVYAHPHDVDLMVGGLLEERHHDAQVGPTFACIITDQMFRTKTGDRYFYKNTNQPHPFAKKQITEIEKVSLANILCLNSDGVVKMQPNAFRRINMENMLVSCKNLPQLDLTYWKDT